MQKKLPLRTCAGCGEKKEKKDLVRIVFQKGTSLEEESLSAKNFFLDESGKQKGRGVYLCKKKACFLLARKKRGLERSLSVRIPDGVYEQLEAFFQGEGALDEGGTG